MRLFKERRIELEVKMILHGLQSKVLTRRRLGVLTNPAVRPMVRPGYRLMINSIKEEVVIEV